MALKDASTIMIPAQAFAQACPGDLTPGSLFKFRGFWALRVVHGDDLEGFLMLEGENAGRILRMKTGLPQVFCIAAPFCWFPSVSPDAKPTLEGGEILGLTLTTHGPAILGLDSLDQWNPTYLAFAKTGQSVDAQGSRRAFRFEQWSVELCHKDRPFESLATLIEVNRSQNQEGV
jgi:hypothetical protein